MEPPKYRISGTISALEKRNKILNEQKLISKKYEPDFFQNYFKKKLSEGYTPYEAKQKVIKYKNFIKKAFSKKALDVKYFGI
tara:strand:- start:30 stop:275 length:246 start_codon:yes stop_codon:yes gene_type:complete